MFDELKSLYRENPVVGKFSLHDLILLQEAMDISKLRIGKEVLTTEEVAASRGMDAFNNIVRPSKEAKKAFEMLGRGSLEELVAGFVCQLIRPMGRKGDFPDAALLEVVSETEPDCGNERDVKLSSSSSLLVGRKKDLRTS
jgi:hypothetical protein